MTDYIIGVGLSKTGTSTLTECLNHLGYNCLHWGEKAALLYVDKKYDEIFQGYLPKYDSFTDYPWNLMYRMFDNLYNCKFILTSRASAEKWYNSFKNHILSVGHFNTGKLVYGFEDPERDKQKMLNYYWMHNSQVREYFSTFNNNNFLDICFESGDGWPEICDFLNHPVPDIPLPWENKGEDMNKDYRGIK